MMEIRVVEETKMKGMWRVLSSATVYKDPWVELQKDEVIQPNGRSGSRSVVKVKNGVTVLAMDDDMQVYLTKEFHYAVGRITIEAVSGGIEADEAPLDAARRELEEELGIHAANWTCLGVVEPFTSNVLSSAHLFVARNLTFRAASPEQTEQIECVKLSLLDAVQLVLNSGITHGPSCVLVLKTYMLTL